MQELQESKVSYFRTEVKTLEQILKSALVVSENPTICLDASGLFFRSMDNTHVSLMDIRLQETIFQEWNIKNQMCFEVDAKQFLKIVKALNKKQSVKIEIFQDEIKIDQKDDATLLKIARVDDFENSTPIPKINFTSTIRALSEEWKAILRKTEAISEVFEIVKSDHSCIIKSKSDQGQSISTLGTEFYLSVGAEENTSYSLEWLMPFIKSVPKGELIEIVYSHQKPLKAETKISDLGIINYYVAPRVEN